MKPSMTRMRERERDDSDVTNHVYAEVDVEVVDYSDERKRWLGRD